MLHMRTHYSDIALHLQTPRRRGAAGLAVAARRPPPVRSCCGAKRPPPRWPAARGRRTKMSARARRSNSRMPISGAHSSAGERRLHTAEVTGSIPVAPTTESGSCGVRGEAKSPCDQIVTKMRTRARASGQDRGRERVGRSPHWAKAKASSRSTIPEAPSASGDQFLGLIPAPRRHRSPACWRGLVMAMPGDESGCADEDPRPACRPTGGAAHGAIMRNAGRRCSRQSSGRCRPQ